MCLNGMDEGVSHLIHHLNKFQIKKLNHMLPLTQYDSKLRYDIVDTVSFEINLL